MIAQPSIKEYPAWVAARQQRTLAAMQRSNRITGQQVLAENLSLRMIYDAGYVLNSATDTLEKPNG
jgi:hypothetical protein